jgi:membrane-bound lytic murein transglycosylase D
MKRISNLLLSAAVLSVSVFSIAPVNAQLINEQQNVVPDSYDPIAATLDSLLNLSYVQRLNSNSAYGFTSSNFRPYEVPVYSADVIAKRMEKIQTPIPMCYNPMVKEYIDMYSVRKRGLTERVMGLSNLYFPMYEQILDQQGLPIEFKYLSIVESALNPTAVSPMGATGLWQFMLATGKMYDLKINSMIDERRDPEKSTLAACQYFKDMYAIYNDWLLVIAAYNCGPGNVNKAIARSGGKRTFWEICNYLPKETRGYVPAFIAVTYLLSYPAEHNLSPVAPALTYFDADTIMVDQKVSLKAIADATNTPLDMIHYLNPVYKRGIVPVADEPMVVKLPSNKINAYLANLSSIYKPADDSYTPTFASNQKVDVSPDNNDEIRKTYKVRRGDNLQAIAKKYSCTVTELKKWNRLKSTRLKAGQHLTVFVPEKKAATKLAENSQPVKPANKVVAKPVTEPTDDSRFVYHVVAPGDTLWKIAQRYEGMTVQQIKEMNKLQTNDLKVGTRIKVQVQG